MTEWSETPPAATRRNQIRAIIERDGFAKVSTLSALFKISEVTIRADLEALAARHVIERVHGGAVAASASGLLGHADPRGARTDAERRRRIGVASAAMVSDRESVLLSAGKTTAAIARALVDRRDLEGVTVITNSLSTALELEPAADRFTVVVTGGTLRKGQHALADPMGHAVLDRMSVDVGFISCDGVDAEAGVTNIDLPDAEMKRRMLMGSAHRIVVAEGSALGTRQLSRVVPLSAVHRVITDSDADAGQLDRLRATGVGVTTA
ncbi:DeoR/GlpR family DNA-binding transcription regulator [Herbiconiux sp. L3-i23]|uniref:DeoR/GlpR family DNA-binding transcription regulator n=1 Tax=Herbiconiux sp. L3-i23 TaxID=2905871 RepID=UPI002069CC92|nr:DeoR/GlpR family DNA-binding transcription regulator [Herbiconiux sp. L3-i23]BDI22092.1 galactitol utilization operon repressor [Herbiconiux sp. L3-i23]